MKKLLLFLLLLPFLAKSQIVVPRGTKSVAVEDAYLYTTFGFKIPRYADTTAANLMMGHDSIGLVIQTTTVDGIWHRAHSVGAFNKWVLTGTGGGGLGTDTIFVTQIGVGSPQIPLLYAVDGNLRTARLVPGVFTTPAMNLDSGVHIDLDTTGVGGAAYKQWIINNYGPGVGGNIYTIDGTIQTDRHLSGSGTKSLYFDSLLNFNVNNDGSGGSTFINGPSNTASLTVGSHVVQSAVVSGAFTGGSGDYNSGDSTQIYAYITTSHDTSQINIAPLKLSFFQVHGRYLFDRLVQANDTTTYKPLAADGSGNMKRMDGWGGSGGGGGGTATIQTITSGTSGTVTGSNYWVLFNPASALATYTLTLPASPTVGQSVTVMFGGTITAGTVVTAFTVSPNTSQSILDNTPPAGSSVTVDNTIIYDYVATNLWHRRKL